jgi:hypothetical protein
MQWHQLRLFFDPREAGKSPSKASPLSTRPFRDKLKQLKKNIALAGKLKSRRQPSVRPRALEQSV